MDITIKNETLGKMLHGKHGYYNDIGETLNSFVAECHAGGAAMAKVLPEYLNVKAKTFFRKLAEEINELEKQEEEEEGIFYKVGDKFEHPNGIYQLHNLGSEETGDGSDEMVLVKIDRSIVAYVIGYVWRTTQNRRVKDVNKITQEEFCRIANGITQNFKLIKD